jgi:hypothetical protein
MIRFCTLLAALVALPGVAGAHPGHGTAPPKSAAHLVTDHGLIVVVAAFVAVALLVAVCRKVVRA